MFNDEFHQINGMFKLPWTILLYRGVKMVDNLSKLKLSGKVGAWNDARSMEPTQETVYERDTWITNQHSECKERESKTEI